MPQSFVAGQAFWGKIRFLDGEFPAYERPYLVVGSEDEYIEILTVSSVVGKEWKLTLPTNREISNYSMCRKTPSFSYGDIRHVHRIYASN